MKEVHHTGAGGVIDARLDLDRLERTGDPEAIFGSGKTVSQIIELLEQLNAANPNRAVIATRISDEAAAALEATVDGVVVDRVGRVATLGNLPQAAGSVVIVCAGTTDLPVAAEAAATVRAHGAYAQVIVDVGVAGLHRLLGVLDELRAADCLVVVAGMEGALPSVVGGLVGKPIIAVPTSIGYGASLNGLAALMAMLNSCAPGISVVNIDNGYGAGVAAARIARQSKSATDSRSADARRPTDASWPTCPGADC